MLEKTFNVCIRSTPRDDDDDDDNDDDDDDDKGGGDEFLINMNVHDLYLGMFDPVSLILYINIITHRVVLLHVSCAPEKWA
jgi:hypothetical protein